MTPLIKKKNYFLHLPKLLLLSTAMVTAPQALSAPTANPDSYKTTVDNSIVITPLENDRADIGTTLSIEVVDSPAPYGTGTSSLDGNKITYTPPAGFTGTTEFWYAIKDSRGLLTSAPITIAVEASNGIPQDPPFPQAYSDNATTTSGQAITIDVLDNDIGDAIFITVVDDPAPYQSGAAIITNNKIRYTAPVGFVGTSRFWYEIKDSLGRVTSNEITVEVTEPTIDSPYPFAGNDTAETTRGNPITIAPFWNDSGVDLKITEVNKVTSQGSKAEIVGTNRILYTPSIWSTTGDTFWYEITDAYGRTNAAKIVVAVGGEELGAYPTAGSDSYKVNEDSTDNVFDVFSNDTGSGLSFLQLYAYTEKGGRTSDNGGSIKYSPPAGFVGTDEFWYAIEDSAGRTNSAKVTVTVEEVDTGGENQEPDAKEDTLRSSINADEFEIDVLANDVDPNGDTLVMLSVEQARSGSTRFEGGRVFYTPPSFTASDTFRYVISDGRGGTASAAVTIGVIDPENPTTNPTVNNEFITMSAGDTIIIKVLDNDSDPDGDSLILDQVTSGSQGATRKVLDDDGNLTWVEYEALDSATGTDKFYYGVADGLGGNGSGNHAARHNTGSRH